MELLDSYELLEINITLIAKMGHIEDRDVEEPDHDVVPFFIDSQQNVDPEEHHEERNAQDDCPHYEGKVGLDRQILRVVDEGRVDFPEVVG